MCWATNGATAARLAVIIADCAERSSPFRGVYSAAMLAQGRITCSFGCCLLAGALAAGQAAPPVFGIGVLRRDGIVIPFADFDGKRWLENWPRAGQAVDVPVNVRSVPARWWGKAGPHDKWQVWTRSEGPATVRVRQPDWVPVHCMRQIGLRT